MKLAAMVLGLALMGGVGAHAQMAFSVNYGPGQDCYLHARYNYELLMGIKACTTALGQVLSLDDQAATYDNRGVLLNQAGRLDEATQDFNRAMALRPDLGDIYINVGSMLIKQKSYEDALVQINKGMALGASLPHVGYYDRALALELLGRYKEAYSDYKKALEIEPGFTLASDRLKDFTVTTAPAGNPG